jgi:hypothetical protein
MLIKGVCRLSNHFLCPFIPSLKVVILEGSTWFSHYLDRLEERFRLILDLIISMKAHQEQQHEQ